MLLDMNRFTSTSQSREHYWQSVLTAMEPAKVDVPFAILYSLGSDADDDDDESAYKSQKSQISQKSNNTKGSQLCRLEGALGIPTLGLEVSFDRDDDTIVLARLFRKAMAAEGPIVVDANDDDWLPALTNEQDPSRGFGERCKQATV